MPASGDVVAAFIAAVERKDLDAAVGLLAEDVSYENVPMDPIVGRAAVRATLEAFLAPTGRVEWPVLRQLVVGDTVVNERLDRFEIGDGWLELPVAGVFEVDAAGRIRLWRDYFDMTTYTRQLAALNAAT
jgi:limonene-1,2-epoxide hydrolase